MTDLNEKIAKLAEACVQNQRWAKQVVDEHVCVQDAIKEGIRLFAEQGPSEGVLLAGINASTAHLAPMGFGKRLSIIFTAMRLAQLAEMEKKND